MTTAYQVSVWIMLVLQSLMSEMAESGPVAMLRMYSPMVKGAELSVVNFKLAGGPHGEPCHACQNKSELWNAAAGEPSLNTNPEYRALSKCRPSGSAAARI